MRSKCPARLLFHSVLLAGLAGSCALAASAAVQNRIASPISTVEEQEIPDTVHPRARVAADLGPAAGETKLQGMSLRFSMTDEQSAALDQLLADLQNPASPRYHQWLTPAQFGAQFGLASADLAKVKDWLTSQGFTITGVANGGLFLTFDGTVAQAQKAFGTSIHNVSVNGEVHFANLTNASVPSALANIVGNITGLHDFRPKPHVRAHPRFTSSVSNNHYLAPGDLYAIYDINPLLNNGINGAGITIAVTGQIDISAPDVLAFRTASGLSTTNLPTVVVEGADPGGVQTCNNCFPDVNDLAESSLDVEWSGAMAPSAKILFVTGKDVLFNSMTQAIDQNLAPIVTISYGNCEAAWGSSDMNTLNQTFKQANAQGQTILAAAGDIGATDCEGGTSAIEGLAVDFPASSPYVTGLGGTLFNDGSATGATQYWSASNGTTGGSAAGYIPETVWNEDSAGSSFLATGGGISSFFAKPAWQVETGPPGMTTSIVADGSRDVPDIALDAAAAHDQFLYCAQASCVNGYRKADSTLTTAGGTSFDSQIFGGMLALIEQKIGSRVGNANPVLYALGNSGITYNTTGTSVFHDITSGNNNNPCTAGTPNCPNGGTIGYSGAVGYDLATGWGSVDLANLANAWNLATPLGVGTLGTSISSTALTASTTSPSAGANVTLTATVTGSSGTPTGTVQFQVNNSAAGAPVALSGGVATYTYLTSCAALGQQVMAAVYSGDGTYAGSKGPVLATGVAGNPGGAGTTANGSIITTPLIVTVSSGSCPDFSLAPSGAGLSVSGSNASVTVALNGTIPSVTIAAASLNGFTGTVNFAATATSTTSYSPGLVLSPGSVTITSGTTSASTVLSLSGIVADLRTPAAPGISPHTMPWYTAGSGITIASLLFCILPRKRRLGGLLLMALSIVLIGGATGCGSSSQPAPPAANVYAGTYVVTVVGTYKSTTSQVTSHTSTITFLIN